MWIDLMDLRSSEAIVGELPTSCKKPHDVDVAEHHVLPQLRDEELHHVAVGET